MDGGAWIGDSPEEGEEEKERLQEEMTPIEEFAKAARKILWRLHPHLHTEYHEWNSAIHKIRSTHDYTYYQAIVQASKDFEPLLQLFANYNVSEHDPEPGSHGDIAILLEAKRAEEAEYEDKGIVRSEETDQSHRENLTWALEAAGRFLRTKEEPVSCPNDAAYYLYRRAIDEPKEFLAKVTQLEMKAKVDDGTQKAGAKSISELGMMLEELLEEGEAEGGDADSV